jgi:hypothetical protein
MSVTIIIIITDRLEWSSAIWETPNEAVHEEIQQAKIAHKILVLNGSLADATNVSSDITEDGKGLRITGVLNCLKLLS